MSGVSKATTDVHGKSQPQSYHFPNERPGHETVNAAIYNGLHLPTSVDLEGPWIRLLKIRHGRRSDAIHCDLVKRPLYEATKTYTALSYAWSSKSTIGHIFVGAWPEAFPISLHLWHAFKQLREADQDVFVWVDALCIDQRNHDERARQVAIMHQIFENAAVVAIWLGIDGQVSGISNVMLMPRAPEYCRRMWVVQEITYADQCPAVMLGEGQVDMASFLELWETSLFPMHRRLFARLYQNWKGQTERNNARRALLDRLRETRELQCLEPHDRIYALLSIVNEKEVDGIWPDYRMPLDRLFEEVSWRLLRLPGWTLRDFKHLYNSLSGQRGNTTIQLPTDGKAVGERASEFKDLDQGDGILSLLKRSSYIWHGTKSSSALYVTLSQVYVAKGIRFSTIAEVVAMANDITVLDVRMDRLGARQPAKEIAEVMRRYCGKTPSEHRSNEDKNSLQLRAFMTPGPFSIYGFCLAKHSRLLNMSRRIDAVFTSTGGLSALVSNDELLCYCYIATEPGLTQSMEQMEAVNLDIRVSMSRD